MDTTTTEQSTGTGLQGRAPTSLPPGRWVVDPAHSSVEFQVCHLGLVNVKGTFNRFAGELDLEQDPDQSRAEGYIETSSVDTRVQERDSHLRSPAFFDAARFPLMTFRSTRIEPLDAPRVRVTGEVSLRGITGEIVLEGELRGPVHTPLGERIGGRLTGTLDRGRFGMSFGHAPVPSASIGLDVRVELDIEAVREPALAAGRR
jgi:polyisoprenoid-binding protein YceI